VRQVDIADERHCIHDRVRNDERQRAAGALVDPAKDQAHDEVAGESAEALVIKVNKGKRKVPTLKVGDHYFACSPFNPATLAAELNVPLNP